MACDPLKAHRELEIAGLHYTLYHLNKNPYLNTDPQDLYPDLEAHIVDSYEWVLKGNEESHALPSWIWKDGVS